MCLDCHNNLSDDQIQKQLENALRNPQFEKWNSTSVNHMKIAASGHNGLKCKLLAEQLLEEYEQWKKFNTKINTTTR